MLWRWPRRAILLLLLYAANLAFAWTYNVGDAYIFFLPSHYAVALSAGAGIAAITALCARVSTRTVATAAGALILVYPAWRGYDTLPAVDRSWDRRADQLLDEITGNGDFPARPQDAVYGLDTNWQVQNAVEYYMRERKPGVPWFVIEQLEWLEEGDRVARFSDFVRANAEIGRDVVVTERAAEKVMEPPPSRQLDDVEPRFMDFSRQVKSVRSGTPYVLAILRSDREFSLNTTGVVCRVALARAWCHAADTAPVHGRRWQGWRAAGAGGIAGSTLSCARDAGAIRLRHPDGILAADRYHSPRRLWPCRRQPAAHSDPGTRHQLRCPGNRAGVPSTARACASASVLLRPNPRPSQSLIPNP